MILSKSDIQAKIVFAGNSGVGKSHLIAKLCQTQFDGNSSCTVAVDIMKLKLIGQNKQKISLNLWDTAGQEKFRTVSSTYYRGAKAIVFVCSITDLSSLTDLQKWIRQASPFCQLDETITAIVANKIDLNKQYISNEGLQTTILKLQKQLSGQYKSPLKIFFVSAKTGENLNYFKQWIVQCVINSAKIENPLGNRHIYLSVASSSVLEDCKKESKGQKSKKCC